LLTKLTERSEFYASSIKTSVTRRSEA